MNNLKPLTGLLYWFNVIIFPLKMVIPQPIIAKIPGLITNEEIRLNMVGQEVRGRLLDVGCGYNKLVKRYREEEGGDGIGVDVYPWEGIDVIVKDTSKLPYPDSSFDTITFVACLNHIPNREEVLIESHRLLVTGGRVVITNLSPFVSRIWHTWAFWDRDMHERGMKEGEVWGLPQKELRSILEKNGFNIVKMKYFSWGLNQLFVCEKK